MPAHSHLPELLAPAGDWTAACAALQYGADAVYAGLGRFSARAEAANLTADQLASLVRHAHRLSPRRAVYVALNTLVQDAEMPDALDALDDAQAAGADAVIVQDLGVLRLARRFFPRLRLHASTQMAVHNLAGARALADLGVSRVVLARELSLAEIAGIVRQAGLEIEVFVHGALCYGYSGLCLFSSHTCGRSGNRGRCAYGCRQAFAAEGVAGSAYGFSMRDLARVDRLPDLVAAGVRSLKIEGRMKSALYVAAVTDLYRRALDGTAPPDELAARAADIRTVFSRPWTPLYLDGSAPPDAVADAQAPGHRGTAIGRVAEVRAAADGRRWLSFTTDRPLEKHDGLQIEWPGGHAPYGFAVASLRGSGGRRDVVAVPAGEPVAVALPEDAPRVPAGAAVFCSASQAVRRRYAVTLPPRSSCRPCRGLAVRVRLRPDGVALAARAVDGSAEADRFVAAALQPARQPGRTAAAWQEAFARLGDTRWELERIEVDDPAGLYLPASQMQAARRLLVAALDAADDAARAAAREARRRAIEPGRTPALPSARESWTVKLGLDDAPDAFEDADEVVLEILPAGPGTPDAALARWTAAAGRDRLRLALPPIVRGSECDAISAFVRDRLAEGWRRWECADLGGWRLLHDAAGSDLDLVSDGALYVLNRESRGQLAEMGFGRTVCSPEDSLANLCALAAQRPPEAEIILFQHTPLFLSETPPLFRPGGDLPLALRDRQGRRYLCFRRGRLVVTVAERPFCAVASWPELRAAGARRARVDFRWLPLDPAARRRYWCDLRGGRASRPRHTGNLQRGLL